MDEQPKDWSHYTVALGLDQSALKAAFLGEQWLEADKIMARMMASLHRLRNYSLGKQAEESRAEELRS
jgi:hypothetical protein